MDYVPEYGILVNRAAIVSAYTLTPDGQILYRQLEIDANRNGLVGGLVNALFSSRDSMLINVASTVTIKTVDELRKGTKDNVPVKSASN